MVEISEPTRTFEVADQLAFAELSGDFNPMHIDPIAARRTQAGQCVVHGVGGVLWALDSISLQLQDTSISGLDVRFEQFIPLGEPVSVFSLERKQHDMRVQLKTRVGLATSIVIKFGTPGEPPAQLDVREGIEISSGLRTAMTPDFSSIAQMSGTVSAEHVLAKYAAAYPNLAKLIGVARVAAIATLTLLVGMVCPGLHSIFRRFSVNFSEICESETSLQFAVRKADDRLRVVVLNAQGMGIFGTVDCALRQPPVEQLSTIALKSRVIPGAFEGVQALIVGGSRGLGELTAKIIAAGGGKAIVTYAVGQSDAEAVANDIRRAGGTCDVLRLDVKSPIADQLHDLPFVPNHLYYFATTQIFRQKSEVFSEKIFDEFLLIYVRAFRELIDLLKRDGEILAVFSPSSVAIEERPKNVTEYTMAKAAAEVLCADIDASYAGVTVHWDRLPRLLTDQTATVAQVQTASALDVMLPIILKMSGSSKS